MVHSNSASLNNLLITGGPGTGKTGILADYALSIIQNQEPFDRRKILALSFKRHAANDLAQRLHHRLSDSQLELIESYTIDAFVKELLDRFHTQLPRNWQLSADYLIDEELFEVLTLKEKFYAAVGNIFPASDIEAVSPMDFCFNNMTGKILPPEITWSGQCRNDIGWYMWQYFLHQTPSRLDFPMIEALAELIVRSNPLLQLLFQATYKCILLDEFQDITPIHYHFLQTAFPGIRMIAAGDRNQSIMLWAHAMPDVFEVFCRDFHARKVDLNINLRSAPELIKIQNSIFLALDDRAKLMIPGNQERSPGKCHALLFPSDEYECRFVISEVEKQLERGISPREICFIVRDNPESYAKLWNNALDGQNFRFRDESVWQRLLTEPAIQLFFAVIEAAFTSKDKTVLHRYFSAVSPIAADADEYIEQFIGQLPTFSCLQQHFPEKLAALFNRIINFLDAGKLKALYPRYRQGAWLEKVFSDLREILLRNIPDDADAIAALANFHDGRFIPVITVQQCKFFEAHTVFFTGWEDEEFREYSANEEMCGFLIAASRAKEELFFTAALERWEDDTAIDRIQKIYRILQENDIAPQVIQPEI